MGGLGDLAVVDLLEGVDALARGRHGVHQMHGGGNLYGDNLGFEVGGQCRLVGGLIVGREFGSGFPHSHEAQKEKAAGLYSAMPRYRARASGFHMDSFTQTPTTSM